MFLGKLRIKINEFLGWRYGPLSESAEECWHSWERKDSKFLQNFWLYSHHTRYEVCRHCCCRRAKTDNSEKELDVVWLVCGVWSDQPRCPVCFEDLQLTEGRDCDTEYCGYYRVTGVCWQCCREFVAINKALSRLDPVNWIVGPSDLSADQFFSAPFSPCNPGLPDKVKQSLTKDREYLDPFFYLLERNIEYDKSSF